MKRKQRCGAFLLVLGMLLTTLIPTVSAEERIYDVGPFYPVSDYDETTFWDVNEGDWFYGNVGYVYQLGLMRGKYDGQFDPSGTITMAETIALLARIHSIYTGNGDSFEQGSPWYQVYVDYCIGNGLIPEFVLDYGETLNTPAARNFFVMAFDELPDEMWEEQNSVEDGAIPDVPADDIYAPYIYRAYRAGIVTGSDAQGTFYPTSSISRAEAAAVIGRIVNPSQRKSVTLTVGEITLYAANGETVTIPMTEKREYLKNGWKETPYTASSGAVGSSVDWLLDNAPLDPAVTGYTPLDDRIGEIFDHIFTDDMTTSGKVRACYDYLIQNCVYGSSGQIEPYINLYLYNPYYYLDDAGNYQPGEGSFGWIFFDAALETNSAEAYCVMQAADLLDNYIGVCDNYSSAFAVMMRRIGLPCFPIYGSAKGGNSYSAHMLTLLTLDGVDYVFDPQIEDVIADQYGYCSYMRYGKTFAELGDRYVGYDLVEECRRAFGGFVYDSEKMDYVLSLER